MITEEALKAIRGRLEHAHYVHGDIYMIRNEQARDLTSLLQGVDELMEIIAAQKEEIAAVNEALEERKVPSGVNENHGSISDKCLMDDGVEFVDLEGDNIVSSAIKTVEGIASLEQKEADKKADDDLRSSGLLTNERQFHKQYKQEPTPAPYDGNDPKSKRPMTGMDDTAIFPSDI